jgi:hypothetical protein
MTEKNIQASMYLDPTGFHRVQGANPERIVGALGILPQWASEAFEHDDSFKQAMITNYGNLYGGEMTGGAMDMAGVYNYPEDPPLHPLAVMTADYTTDKIFFYEYSMVAVLTENGNFWMARFD